jgi:hypothetical protein
VGTAKRERQKANKAKREQELARAHAKSRLTRNIVIGVAALVGVFALVFLVGQFVGDDDEPSTPDPLAPTTVDPLVVPDSLVSDTLVSETLVVGNTLVSDTLVAGTVVTNTVESPTTSAGS